MSNLRELSYELDGVICDVEKGGGFDAVCLRTVKRVRDALAEQPQPEPVQEAGPWHARRSEFAPYRWHVESDDFEHDVSMPIHGDFGSDEKREAYAHEIARRLNAAPPPSAPEPQPRIDPMQNPLRPTLAKLGPPDEHPAEEVLRKLACWLGVGGYNAPTVDADVFHRKIVDGVESLLAVAARQPSAPEPSAPTLYDVAEAAGVKVMALMNRLASNGRDVTMNQPLTAGDIAVLMQPSAPEPSEAEVEAAMASLHRDMEPAARPSEDEVVAALRAAAKVRAL